VHCWVLITPEKRTDVESLTFIEATTGRFYTTQKDCPYLSVECIWSNQNYWVNLQDQKKPISSMDWDLSNNSNWASVFDTTEEKGEEPETPDVVDFDGSVEDEDGETKKEQIVEEKLDLPPSWVELIEIPQSVFNQRFGEKRQEKVVLYSKAKHEMFPQHMHKEGLTSRVTVYEDEDYTIPVEVREELYARADKLVRRLRYPLEGRTVEDFDPGRTRKLVRLEQIMGKSHKMVFNSFARLDGLVERSEQFGKEMVEKFEGRDDRLIYRQVTVLSEESSESSQTFTLPGGTVGEFLVDEMVQKFSKDPNSLSNLDQDLPNYAQHVVPIHSLPEEWLWCETWCGNTSKPRAKTIDLCNNPLTKEPKLNQATRVIGQRWTDLDEQVKAVAVADVGKAEL